MTFLRSIPSDAPLIEVFKAYPETARVLIDYHETLMRGPSPLAVGERELIAAFVSGLNACAYCHGVHAATAREFGIEPERLKALLADVESATDSPIKPILRYVKKLTLSPARISPADADAVFAAGWHDRALHDAVSVCALFNMMNRLVEGLGVRASGEYFALAGRRLHAGGYSGLKALLPSQS